MMCIADSAKPEAIPAVSALQRMGIKVVMLTGDNTRTAWAIAQQVLYVLHALKSIYANGYSN